MPADVNSETLVMDVDISSVPLVSHATALSEPQIRHAAVQKMLHLPSEPLMSARAHASSLRRMWQRFVAVRIPAKDAFPMEPVNFPEALAIIDRHYNVLTPYQPHRVSLYAARRGSHLMIRYLEYQSHHLILRPHSRAFPIDLIEIENGTSPSEFIVGRVALVLNEV